MNTGDVKDMFRSYTDEADTTFLTDAQTTLYLSEGYSDFRRAVCDIDPFIYSIQFLFDLSDTNILDLTATTPKLLSNAAGPALAGFKLERLLRVARINTQTDNSVIQYLDAAPSERTMNDYFYTFINDQIIFSSLNTGSYRLEYVPFHNVNFAAAADMIDNLDGYHDMIPLYAYLRYAIRDGADNPQVQSELGRKTGDLKTFLETGRSREGSQYVNSYDNW